MAVNNIVNFNDTGIMSFDGIKVFTGLAIPLTVPNGGTGATSFTAYTVICAGTTSTGAFQNVAAVGTSGQGLNSAGAGALPTFGDIGGYTFNWSINTGNPSDAATYWLVNGFSLTGTTNTGFASTRFYIPKDGIIIAAYGVFTGSAGSAEATTIKITLNNTTDINITTTLSFASLPVTYNNSSLSQAVVAGDYLEIKMVCPTWVTNPGLIQGSITVYIR